MIDLQKYTWKPVHAGGHNVYTWEARHSGRPTIRIMEIGLWGKPYCVYKGSPTKRKAR